SHGIHYASAMSAKFSVVAVGHITELLYGVWIREDVGNLSVRIFVDSAIQVKGSGIRSPAARRNHPDGCFGTSAALLVKAGTAQRYGWARVGREGHQLKDVAAI